MDPTSVLPPETRRRLNEHDRWWSIQFGMRAFSALLAFIAMILFATTTNLSKRHYGGNDWVDGMPLAPVLLALLYNPFVLALTLYWRKGRSMHPGWHVGVDLFIWGLSVPAVVFSIGDGWFWYWQPVLLEFDGLIPCNEFNFWSRECNPLIYKLGKMEIAANVFLALILIIHFALFVLACIATHKHRVARTQDLGGRRNIELMYHRNPEDHQNQQPPSYEASAAASLNTVLRVRQENDPFKDSEHGFQSRKEDPFSDDSAIKYA